jgi:hypothetical protein
MITYKRSLLTAIVLATELVPTGAAIMAQASQEQGVARNPVQAQDAKQSAPPEKTSKPASTQKSSPKTDPGRRTINEGIEARLRVFSTMNGLSDGIPVDKSKSISTCEIFAFRSSDIPPNANAKIRAKPVREAITLPAFRVASIPLRDHQGALLMAVSADGRQSQLPSTVYHDVTIIPFLPVGVRVLKISPGEVEFLVSVERVTGGTAINVSAFDASSMILCTTEEALANLIRDAVERSRGKKVHE